MIQCTVMMAGAEDLLEGGHALANLEHAIIKKISRPLGFGIAAHFLGRCTLESHFTQLAIKSQHLINALAAPIACFIAV